MESKYLNCIVKQETVCQNKQIIQIYYFIKEIWHNLGRVDAEMNRASNFFQYYVSFSL